MFIDRNAESPPAPFGGAERIWYRLFNLHSAPPNGAAWVELRCYKHLIPNGVKTFRTVR